MFQIPPSTKAILLDSGGVLFFPVSGHWFLPPRFFETVPREGYEALPKERVRVAFREAARQLGSASLVPDTEAEYRLFTEFYKSFFSNLPELQITQTQAEAVARDLVYNPGKYAFFDDAREVVPKLRERFRLGVISDGWVSMENVYEHHGMRAYFDTLVISTLIGSAKPQPEMYQTALRRMGVSPGEAVFIDDSPKNCLGAERLGIRSCLLCRNRLHALYWRLRGFRAIVSLKELKG